MYITTSQNYIRTKPTAAEVELFVELVGGENGDEKDFVWTIADPSIISMQTVNGRIGNSRAVNLFQRAGGRAYITGLKEGITAVAVSHPKIIGATEILVRVYPETTVMEVPLYIRGPALLGIARGETETASVTMAGSYTPSDEALLSWASDNTGIVSVQGNGKDALVTANGTGTAYITVSHPKAEGPKKILCHVAETKEEVKVPAYKLLYTEKTLCAIFLKLL
jgi:uncharacterized protein YjdB